MLKFITEKLLGQILPSVVATVLGAYVVNQYINKPDAPPATQAVKLDAAKAVEPTAALASPAIDADRAEPAKSRAAEKPTRHLPTIREKAAADKAAADKLAADKAAADKAAADKLAAEKAAADKLAADKAAAKPVPAAVADKEKAQDDRREAARDPNDVLRAAVERLRASDAPRPAPADPVVRETARVQPEPAKPQEPPRAAALQPLPPAVNVGDPTPLQANTQINSGAATYGTSFTGSVPSGAATADAGFRDPRLTPPADIPTAGANPDGLAAQRRPSVAEDVLFAAKSVIHSVLPR